jgi:hypothetical protein
MEYMGNMGDQIERFGREQVDLSDRKPLAEPSKVALPQGRPAPGAHLYAEN